MRKREMGLLLKKYEQEFLAKDLWGGVSELSLIHM